MTESDSLAIKICRVLCIFFMTYVHVNPGKDSWSGEIPEYLAQLGYILSDVLGRASVPALSVLGGYLAVSAYSRRPDWWIYAKERWQTLIIPLITWNVVIIVLSLFILWLTGAQTSIIRDLLPFNQLTPLLIADRLTGYNYGSATTALNFLRDIFICSLLFPLVLQFIKRLGFAGVGIIWLAGLTIGFAPVIMRPNILMFFTVGIYMAHQSNQLIPTLNTAFKILTTLLIALALVYFIPVLEANYGKNLPNTALRLAVASCFLITAIALSRTKVGKLIARLEPLAYLMFLSHATIMLLFWGAWQKFFGNDLAWPYAVFFVVAPFATLIALLVVHKVLTLMPATAQKILNGKTISRRVHHN